LDSLALLKSLFFTDMFEDLYSMLDRAINLDENEAFKIAVNEEVKKLIIQLNTVKQLGDLGIDAEGDSLGEYAPFTIEKRSDLGLQVSHIDFKVKGNYWKSWKVEVVGDNIEIDVDKV